MDKSDTKPVTDYSTRVMELAEKVKKLELENADLIKSSLQIDQGPLPLTGDSAHIPSHSNVLRQINGNSMKDPSGGGGGGKAEGKDKGTPTKGGQRAERSVSLECVALI